MDYFIYLHNSWTELTVNVHNRAKYTSIVHFAIDRNINTAMDYFILPKVVHVRRY